MQSAIVLIRAQMKRTGSSFIDAERAVLGYDHCDIGARVARSWGLPQHIVQAVALQRDQELEHVGASRTDEGPSSLIPDSLAGSDVHRGVATISGQRLYGLVDLPRPGRHVLTLRPRAGISGYAFTFG